jgi:hypothetical protein
MSGRPPVVDDLVFITRESLNLVFAGKADSAAHGVEVECNPQGRGERQFRRCVTKLSDHAREESAVLAVQPFARGRNLYALPKASPQRCP